MPKSADRADGGLAGWIWYHTRMLQYAPQINAAVKGLGAVVDNQHTVVRFLVKNWAISGIAGLALASQLYRRYKKGELTPFTGMTDAGLILSPMVALFTINQMAQQTEIAERLIKAGGAPPPSGTTAPVQVTGGARSVPIANKISMPTAGGGSETVTIAKKIA